MNFEIFLIIFNYMGTVAFAASGFLKGTKYKLDIFGLTLLAIITACGGGILRDILLSEIPDALTNPEGLYIALGTSVIMYFFVKYFKESVIKSRERNGKRYKVLHISNLIFDSVGLCAFAIVGANKGVSLHQNLITTAILATLTGGGGSVIRDILIGEIPEILKEDIYAVLAFAMGLIYYLMIKETGFSKVHVAAVLFVISLIIRLLIIKFKINLPVAEG